AVGDEGHEEAMGSGLAITIRALDTLAEAGLFIAELEPEAVGTGVDHDRYAGLGRGRAHRGDLVGLLLDIEEAHAAVLRAVLEVDADSAERDDFPDGGRHFGDRMTEPIEDVGSHRQIHAANDLFG